MGQGSREERKREKHGIIMDNQHTHTHIHMTTREGAVFTRANNTAQWQFRGRDKKRKRKTGNEQKRMGEGKQTQEISIKEV